MTHPLKIRFGLSLIAAIALPVNSVWADEPKEAPACYDAVIEARTIRQTPSVFPDCGDDCIVMVWPWFLELRVTRVVSGPASTGRMITLTMQHTDIRKDLGATRWWLRRNSLGGFNVLRFAEADGLSECSADAPAAEPYIRPGPGQTLNSLLRDAKRAERD